MMPVKEFSICSEYDGKDKKDYGFYRCFIAVKNNWFEGIIVENSFDNRQSNIGLVFGLYFPNRIIEMFSCFDKKITRYCMEREINSYIGNFSTINMVPAVNGSCVINEVNHNVYTEAEISNKVNICKSLLDYDSRNFYECIVKHKDDFLLISGYQGRPFEKLSTILGNDFFLLGQSKRYDQKYMTLYNDKKGYDWRI